MADQTRGLYGKYEVQRRDGKPIKGGRCIVLEVGDPNTWDALLTWADTVEAAGFGPLADDTRTLVANAKAGQSQQGQPLCGGCNPPPHGERITQTVWLCPKHQAEQDAFLAKYGDVFIKRTEREA